MASKKFVPYEKLSKKKQREYDKMKRITWGCLNPVTRNTANPKAYDRKKARKWNPEDVQSVPFLSFQFVFCQFLPSCFLFRAATAS